MQSIINIKDQPCGSGKTTSMIEGFQQDRKYLVIVPELTEVARVIEGSKFVPFQQPHANDNEAGTKTKSLENLMLNGMNIVATHKLHENLVPLAKDGLLDDYDIIIDEVPNVVKHVAEKSSTSIEEFYVDSGYMLVDQYTGLVTPTQKWWSNKNHVNDTLDRTILGYAAGGCLYLLEGKFFIWAMPRELLTAGRTTTILTYKSEGSMLLAYLRKLNVPSEVANDNNQENTFRRQAAELITICDIPALSKLKLSYNGQSKGLNEDQYCRTVVTALKNLRGRQLKDVPIENILITCIKNGWYKNGDEKVAGPFASGSKLFKGAKWIANTTRGTNNHAHCSHLIYLHDQHINPFVARWLGDSSQEFKDAYALTELIQWVWRSRVRKGRPITLYLPSPRMRRLMEEWLSS
tara:strand:- start:146 stop:1363 length:1218 start_codon:yes stop_codon:yes gene_type:complete